MKVARASPPHPALPLPPLTHPPHHASGGTQWVLFPISLLPFTESCHILIAYVHFLLLFPEEYWKYINWKFGQIFCSITLLKEFYYYLIHHDSKVFNIFHVTNIYMFQYIKLRGITKWFYLFYSTFEWIGSKWFESKSIFFKYLIEA